jgi:hypothetical protein
MGKIKTIPLLTQRATFEELSALGGEISGPFATSASFA